MKIVIDIPEEIASWINEYSLFIKGFNGEKMDIIIDAITNGTPLPEGHGRLIDADEAIKTLKSLGDRDYRRKKGTIQEAEKMLSFDEYTPTIIEADKEAADEI